MANEIQSLSLQVDPLPRHLLPLVFLQRRQILRLLVLHLADPPEDSWRLDSSELVETNEESQVVDGYHSLPLLQQTALRRVEGKNRRLQ